MTQHFTLSGDAEHVYVSNAAGRIVATLPDKEQATFVQGALNVLVSLHGSGVWGLHDDGSVWVQGGAWEKHGHYCTADSPMAVFMRSLVDAAQPLRYFGPDHHAAWCTAVWHEGYCVDAYLARLPELPPDPSTRNDPRQFGRHSRGGES